MMTFPRKEILPSWSLRNLWRCGLWLLCIGSANRATALQIAAANYQAPDARAYAQRPDPAKAEAGKARGRSANGETKRSSTSASSQEPTPARVVLENGNLTVEADNSDLGEILKTVAGVTGMTIDGNIHSSRVYGVYGPRNPREVLTDLLQGTGYNFIMVGVTRNGAPRELLLSAEKTRSLAEPLSTAAKTAETPDSESRNPDQPGPGAIVHVPPPPSDDPQQRVQQNLERLRQMHEKLKEQNAPQ